MEIGIDFKIYLFDLYLSISDLTRYANYLLFNASITASAVMRAENGFCPVIRLPSRTFGANGINFFS